MINLPYVVLVYLIYMIVHELGHFYYFRYILKRNVYIHFGKYKGQWMLFTGQESDYKGLTNKQKQGVYMSGILTGFIFLFGVFLTTSDINYQLIWMIYFLFGGWWGDFRKYQALEKEEK